jgi:hypothetical protein
MTYESTIQNVEVSAEKFKSLELYLSEEEYEQIKLDNTAFIQAIMAALEASDETEVKTIELVLTAVAGPQQVAVVLIAMGAFMLPNQQKVMEEFIKEGRATRKVFVDAVSVMSERLRSRRRHCK